MGQRFPETLLEGLLENSRLAVAERTRRLRELGDKMAQSGDGAFSEHMMKAVVYENMGAGAIAARQFPSDFTIAVDSSNAPSITYEFPHQNVLDICNDIAEIQCIGGDGAVLRCYMEAGQRIRVQDIY